MDEKGLPMRFLKNADHVKIIDSSGKSLNLPNPFKESSLDKSKQSNLVIQDIDYNTCVFAGSIYEFLKNKIILCEMFSTYENRSLLTKESMLNLKNICIKDEVHHRLGSSATNLKLIMRGWIGGSVSHSYKIKIFEGSIDELREYVNSDDFYAVTNHLMVEYVL